MIVTTVLLTMVWYIVWGFTFIVPLAFLLFFGVLDGAFFARIFPTVIRLITATLNKLRRMVPLYGSCGYDLLHGILEMGNVQKTCVRTGSTSTSP